MSHHTAHEHTPNEELGRKRRRAVLVTYLFWGVVGLLLVSSNVIALVNTFQTKENTQAIKETQNEGSPVSLKLLDIIKSVQATQDQIISCTTPKGDCAKRSNRLAQRYFGGFNESSLLAAVCAVGYIDEPVDQRLRDTQQCVTDLTTPPDG